MLEAIASWSIGQKIMAWVIGAFIAHMTTGFKDGMEGCLGILCYFLFSFIVLIIVALNLVWNAL